MRTEVQLTQSVFSEQQHTLCCAGQLSRLYACANISQSYRHAHKYTLHILFCFRDIKLMKHVLSLQLSSHSQKIFTNQSVEGLNCLRVTQSQKRRQSNYRPCHIARNQITVRKILCATIKFCPCRTVRKNRINDRAVLCATIKLPYVLYCAQQSNYRPCHIVHNRVRPCLSVLVNNSAGCLDYTRSVTLVNECG